MPHLLSTPLPLTHPAFTLFFFNKIGVMWNLFYIFKIQGIVIVRGKVLF